MSDQHIVSIQVVPTTYDGHETVMLDAPQDNCQWSVYERRSNGQVVWRADYSHRLRLDAFRFGNEIAKRQVVAVEYYSWMTNEDCSAAY